MDFNSLATAADDAAWERVMSDENPYYGLNCEEVPSGYDLLDAPQDKLDLYGIPQKPDRIAEPSLFEFWSKLVSPLFTAKQPKLTPIDKFLQGSQIEQSQSMPSLGGTVQSSLNWSGAIISPCWPKRFVLATAGWLAPKVSRPSAEALFTAKNLPRSLVWVGLDGYNGTLPKISLPQIGTAHFPDHQPQQHFAWWGWWSKHSTKERIDEFVIEEFKIAAGDEILAGLEVLRSEDVRFFIKNQSTGEFRSFLGKRQPLRDIEQLGSSAEWVVERPTAIERPTAVERPTEPKSEKLYPLADYDPPVDFKYCLALAADKPCAPGRLMTLADNGLIIKMREAFADPYRTIYVSRAERRHDPDGSIGVRCTFHDPT
jgi:hypothetical protein